MTSVLAYLVDWGIVTVAVCVLLFAFTAYTAQNVLADVAAVENKAWAAAERHGRPDVLVQLTRARAWFRAIFWVGVLASLIPGVVLAYLYIMPAVTVLGSRV